MMEFIGIVIQVAMFVALMVLLYVIVQVVDVIREEKERLMWYRNIKSPARTEDASDDKV